MSSEQQTEQPESATRRGFIGAGAALLAAGGAHAAQPASQGRPGVGDATLDQLARAGERPILVRGGAILSMDRQLGDFERGDLLMQGRKIVAVGGKVAAPDSALVIDARGMIVMPGFIDTHHHQYEVLLRGALADGLSARAMPLPPVNYFSLILQTLTPAYTPEDARIAELHSSLSQISAGVTTTVDTSQVHLTPEHTDACIAGLREAGQRVLFAYGPGVEAAGPTFVDELARLRKQYFSSADQLLTLASHGRADADWWRATRAVGASIVTHIIGTSTGDLAKLRRAGMMGPDNEYIHCTRITDDNWRAISETGGKVSIAPAIELAMQQGYPPLQQALGHGIKPSLSVDVECSMTADLFSVMRAAFISQRGVLNERMINGEHDVPPLVSCRDVIEMATINGARVTHLDARTGSLTPGKDADVVMLDADRINLFPLNNVPGAVATLMDTSNVAHVFIAGRVRKWRGELVGVDVRKLRGQSEAARDRVFAAAKVRRNLFGSCCMS